jgi:hypothetical protein
MNTDDNARRSIDAWRSRLDELRFRGYGGWAVRQHRAIFQMPLQRSDVAIAVLLPLVFSIVQLFLLDQTADTWRMILEFWNQRLDLGGVLGNHAFDLGYFLLWLPQLEIPGNAPSADIWWWTLAACVAIFAGTFYVSPERLLPGIYVVRACLVIQASALAYFYWLPGAFPYELESYICSNMFSGLAMMFLIPWLLGLTYYIFDFPLRQKVALTALILVFFAVAIPMQYLAHAYLLKHLSMLFMPILYIVFGMFVDVLILIALYSWGMSWRLR